MEYDIIFITGEEYFDHPLSGVAILKRLLEKNSYAVAVISMPKNEKDITKYGKPKLFFGVSSGSIDSMVRNYTPLKKRRDEDKNLNYNEYVPDRALTVYCNWIKKYYKNSKIVIGGTEATLRRFSHYDYWQNRIRKSVLLDTRADILVYGSGEKQSLEIAERTKSKKSLNNILGTCIVIKEKPEDISYIELPSHDDITEEKEKFCDMQLLLTNKKNLIQKQDNRYIVQYEQPEYNTKDLDEYYSLNFSRNIPKNSKHLRGFQFSIVTHRGCFGNCNFCTLKLTQGDKIISRSEKSIIEEAKKMVKHPDFRGNIDDLTGPSCNMYGMDCTLKNNCNKNCITCEKLITKNNKLLSLLKKLRKLDGIKNVYIKSGIRYDLIDDALLKEITTYHIFDTLRIAPEHTNKNVLKLMNKNKGNLKDFINKFKKIGKGNLSFYFMTAHPGSSMKEAKELSDEIKKLKNAESVQVFTPTPMSMSTCMYYTGMDPKTKEKIHVPYSYKEKKEQKRAIIE